MSVLFVGDVHVKADSVLAKVDAVMSGVDTVVFLGDLTDDWHADARAQAESLSRLADWVDSARGSGVDVRVLLGNHDLPYLLDARTKAYRRVAFGGPGYDAAARPALRPLLRRLAPTVAAPVGIPSGADVLASHAGLTGEWLEWLDCPATPGVVAERLNALLDLRPDLLGLSVGPARGGRRAPGPLWADWTELKADPAPGLVQVVGHTPVRSVERYGRLWCCDTFSTMRDGTPLGDGSLLLAGPDGWSVL